MLDIEGFFFFLHLSYQLVIFLEVDVRTFSWKGSGSYEAVCHFKGLTGEMFTKLTQLECNGLDVSAQGVFCLP